MSAERMEPVGTTTTHGQPDGPTWITDDTGNFVPYWSGPQILAAIEAEVECRTDGEDWNPGAVAALRALKARLGLEP